MLRIEIPLIASSDTAVGAVNVSTSGDSFQIELAEPIKIPREAINIIVSMEESTVWWVVPNILDSTAGASQNNLMKIVDTGADSGVPATYNLVIPQGLYDLAALNQSILRELANAGAPTSPTLINMSADDATQKVEITANYIGISIDFTIALSFRDILGWGSVVLGPTIAKPTTFLAPNIAAFNTINYFLLHCDLLTRGVRYNNTYSQVLDQVLIDVAPGSQIISAKFRPPEIPEPDLAGTIRNNIRFWITDDQLQSINTNQETWSARIVVKYNMPPKESGVMKKLLNVLTGIQEFLTKFI